MTVQPIRHTAAFRRASTTAMGLAALALVAGCASGPSAPPVVRDGPEARPPPGLSKVPDAEPKVEQIRTSGPNKPYEVLGKDYVPMREDAAFTERGLASWYGKKFHGRRTASGETYNMYAMTAAHKTMPIPSYARVRNPKNGREIVVRINDRGPFHAGRIIDLSYTAAMKIGLLNGIGAVEVERITHDQIRSGAWRRGTVDAPATATATPDAPAARPSADVRPAAFAANDDPSAPARPTPVAADATAAGTAPLPPVDANAPPVADAPAARALTAASQGFWIQLGAFRQREGAEQFQRRVSDEADWIAPLLAVFTEPAIHRLQAGPYPSRTEAQTAATRLRDALQLVPVIVEKRR